MQNANVIPPRARLSVYKPTAEEMKLIRDGMGFLAITQPFWSSILYAELTIKFTLDVPYAATDSHSIFVNPRGMIKEGWGFEEVAFVLAHEVMHYIFGDLILAVFWRKTGQVTGKRVWKYVHDLMNRAMDYRINAALIAAKIGKFPKIGLFDPKLSATGMESCIEIYEKLAANMPPPPPGGSGGQGDSDDHGGFDQHLEPSQQDVDDASTSGHLRKVQVVAAALQAHAAAGMGDLPGAIGVLVGELLDPKVFWGDHLRTEMMRSSGEPRLDWTKLNKHMITRPQRISFARKGNYGCGTVAIAIDTSGSVFSKTTEFLSEAAGIVADLNPERVVIIWCDADIGKVHDLEEPEDLAEVKADIDDFGVPGGGGTSFIPVFDYIHENGIQPDMLVYLTDTYGSFPAHEPDYKVIWGSIVNKPTVPWGTVVEIEIED